MAAFDTENKRRAALNTALFQNLPIAAGTIGPEARAMRKIRFAYDYRTVLDLFKPQINSLKQSGLIKSMKEKGLINSLKQSGLIKWEA